MSLYYGLGDCQPEAAVAGGAGARRVTPVEAVKYVRQIFGCDTRPLILNIDEHLIVSEVAANGHQHRLAWRGEAHSVVYKVQYHLAQLIRLSLNDGGLLRVHDKADVFRLGYGGHLSGDVAKKVPTSTV